jgi:uncharacterized protein (DUF2141 family)
MAVFIFALFIRVRQNPAFMKSLKSLWVILLLSITLVGCHEKQSSHNHAVAQDEKEVSDTSAQTQVNTEEKPDTIVAADVSDRVPLKLTVHQVSSDAPRVKVAVYNSNKNFLLKEGRIKEFFVQPKGEIAEVEIKGLEYGVYAIVVFEDLNNSGDMDRNAVGLPKERYGLSNNFVPKVKKPSFKNCAFEYSAEKNKVRIELQ